MTTSGITGNVKIILRSTETTEKSIIKDSIAHNSAEKVFYDIPSGITPGNYFVRVRQNSVKGDSGIFGITKKFGLKPGAKGHLKWIEVKEPQANEYWDCCGDKLYFLIAKWGGKIFYSTPGYMVADLFKKKIYWFDGTNLVYDWAYGIKENYGLLLRGPKEKFEKERDRDCVSFFKAFLQFKYSEAEK